MWNLISEVCVDRIDWRRVRRRQDCQAKKEKNKAQFGFKAHPYTPWLTAQSFLFASILKVQLFLKFLPKRVLYCCYLCTFVKLVMRNKDIQ
jgi:hypothetical protein